MASLLLGFGWDAWVCFAKDAVGQQTWALTRSSREQVVLWDPSTGVHFQLLQSATAVLNSGPKCNTTLPAFSSDQVRQLSMTIAAAARIHAARRTERFVLTGALHTGASAICNLAHLTNYMLLTPLTLRHLFGV